MKIQFGSMAALGLVVLGMAVWTPSAIAKSFKDACPDLQKCMQAVSLLTHEQYLYSDGEVGTAKIQSSDNLELTAENANLLFTNYLHMHYLSRVPIDAKTFKIMRENDAKGAAVPHYQASFTEDAKIPDTADIINVTYTAAHPESVRNMENVLRTFTNMGARIQGDVASGTLMMTSNANEIVNLLPTFRKLDVKNEKTPPSSSKPDAKQNLPRPSVERDPKHEATPDPK